MVTTLVYGAFFSKALFLFTAGGLSVLFFVKIVKMRKGRGPQAARQAFVFSIIYLFGLFSAMILDKFITV